MTNYVICGAGLVGMLTARELAKAGMDVTIIDRQRCGQESSWAGGGILSPLFPWLFPEAVTRLAQWGQTHYRQLALDLLDETGIDSEWKKNGLLVIAHPNHNQIVDWADRYHYETNLLESDDLHSREPYLAQEFQKAVLFPQIAQIRNPRLGKAMRASLIKSGVTLLENTEIQGIKTHNGVVTAVMANGSMVSASHVIVAGGAWSTKLLQPFNCDLKVEPVRGQMLSFKTEPGMIRHVVLGRDHYLIPRLDGLVLAGSTLEYTGFEKTPTKEAFDKLYQRALNIVPELSRYPIQAQWSGLRPGNTREGVPYICQVNQIEGLYVNTGHFRNGVVLGYASATLMVDILLGRKPILDPSPFDCCV
ncbi:Glycine oxidase ThiO [hydrothermal vent metagenome]|uniref:Glycine oxidase ThiO n=1 Tax=hydrothermal vent metagenome TaxID=652676 RepID=A0A3B0YE30_9ZZZZ